MSPKYLTTVSIIAFGFLATVPSQSVAEEDYLWSVGLGGAVITSPYASADDIVAPIPYFAYQGDRLALSPFGASFAFFDRPGLSFALVAAPRFQAVDRDEAPALAGMADRDPTAELGGRMDMAAWFGVLRVEALSDVLDVHGGQQVSIGYGVDISTGDLTISPRIGAAWQSAELVDYYYGVRRNEARSNRAAYSADDAVVMSLGLDLDYALTQRLSAVAFLAYDAFPEEITKSPIVEDDNAAKFTLGLTYSF